MTTWADVTTEAHKDGSITHRRLVRNEKPRFNGSGRAYETIFITPDGTTYGTRSGYTRKYESVDAAAAYFGWESV